MLFSCHVIFSVSAWLFAGATTAAPSDSREEGRGTTIDISTLGPRIYGRPDELAGHRVDEWQRTNGGGGGAGNAEEQGTYFEGDILFPNAVLRNGLVAQSRHWEDGMVPVEIDKSFSKEDVNQIKRAMREYHTHTCIKFVERMASDKDYVLIQNTATGCWSPVGRVGGRQEANLQSGGCTRQVGTIMHELMHALGFMHEHTREDRDSYITVHWQNIRPKDEGDFKKAEKGKASTFGVAYDYSSIQHYSPMAFSSNGQKTITAKQAAGEAQMGQRDKFSEKDLKKINAMYKCGSKAKRDNSLTWMEQLIKLWGGGEMI